MSNSSIRKVIALELIGILISFFIMSWIRIPIININKTGFALVSFFSSNDLGFESGILSLMLLMIPGIASGLLLLCLNAEVEKLINFTKIGSIALLLLPILTYSFFKAGASEIDIVFFESAFRLETGYYTIITASGTLIGTAFFGRKFRWED